MDEECVSVQEAAKIAGVTPSTVYRWLQGGVLSLRYFKDGRQAIATGEILKVAQTGENEALVRLFDQVARSLAQAGALVPALEPMFGPGWEGHAWPADHWREIQVMAVQQAEAHRDIRPFVRTMRGRPRVADAAGAPVDSVRRAIEKLRQGQPGKREATGVEIVQTLAPFLDAADGTREIITPQVLGLLLDLIKRGELKGTVILADAAATRIEL